MAIIVEDGSIVVGANSYVSEAELTTYASTRGITITAGDREKWLTLAMDYLESLNFIGTQFTIDQALQWPRIGAVIDGWLVDSDEIPNELRNVQLHLATNISQGVDPTSNISRAVKRRKVGDLEIEYMDGAASTTLDRKLSLLLRKLVSSGVSGREYTVGKG